MKSKRKKRKFYILTADYEHVIKEKNLYKGKYPIAEN